MLIQNNNNIIIHIINASIYIKYTFQYSNLQKVNWTSEFEYFQKPMKKYPSTNPIEEFDRSVRISNLKLSHLEYKNV